MKIRRIIFNFHLYLGLASGLILVLSGLTGSMIVFREEIETLAHPELMDTTVRDARVPFQTVLYTVQDTYPEDKIFSVRMPRTPQQTYQVRMNNAHDLLVYADPYSGKILGAHRQEDTLIGWIALLHNDLLIGESGKNILGASALLLIVISITGFVLWWPPNGKGKITQGLKVNWLAPWKRVIFDMHRAAGIYSLFFLLIIAITGASLVYNKTAAELANFLAASPPRPASPVSFPSDAGETLLSIDDLLQQAERILPAATITWVNFPQTPQASLVVRKKSPEESHPNGRNFIYFDQYTGKVLHVEDTTIAPLGARIYNVLYPIHTGAIGGTYTRILQVIIGLMPVILFVTGYVMWRNRRKVKR